MYVNFIIIRVVRILYLKYQIYPSRYHSLAMRIFKHNQPQNYIKILDYTYTSQPSINSALPLQFSNIRLILYIMSCVLTLGFVWLLAKWSPKKKAIMLYSVCSIQQACAFLIIQQDVMSGSTIVPRMDRIDIKRRANVISFCYHDRNFQYHQQKQVFLPIRYEDLGIQLDKLKKYKYQPYSTRSRKKLLQYYGYNQILLNVQYKIQIFIEQMLTPYQVFQLYAIILWIYQQYYIFAFMLLAYSMYTYWDSSNKIVNNQKILAQRSYFNTMCKIITKKKYDQSRQSTDKDKDKRDMRDKKKKSVMDMDMDQGTANDSQDYTIIQQQQIRSNTQQNQKKQINLSQQIQYIQNANNNNNNQHIQSHSSYKTDSQRQHPLKHTMSQNKNNNNSHSQSHSTHSQLNTTSHTNKIQLMSIQSRNILPGDIIILTENQIVPCDCVILSGQAIVDESYISGENYLIRKSHLEDYQYSKDRQKGFILYLGTKIVKIKNWKKQEHKHQNMPFTTLSDKPLKLFLQSKEIACLVTQTNYNTQRGKYLRAIRYQKKPVDNFTRQTIYFIYIILVLTVAVFMALLPIVDEKQSDWDMFVMFLDMLATSIPITLPTALSVGINFAQRRLTKCGIRAILPSNILAGGRATTVVLDSNKVLSKNYQVSSIVVGVKANKSIGNTYSSLSQFLDLTNPNKLLQSQSFHADPINKKIQINKMQESGKMLLRAFATCHALEKYNNQLSGSTEERHLFQFCQGKYIEQDMYQCLGDNLTIKQRIYFKQKDKKLAVIVQMSKKSFYQQAALEILQQQVLDKSRQRVQRGQLQLTSKQSINSNQDKQKLLFIKGPAQKIIKICKQGTYPIDYHDYVVDIAQKGFKTLGFAYKKLPYNFNSAKSLEYLKQQFIFCGFALLQAQKLQDTIQTITQLKQARMQLTLISQQRQLQTSSVAINNKLCTKNQLILCSLHHGNIKCTGHMQWQSSGQDDLNQFIMQSDTLTKNSYLSLNARLFEQLFMKRDQYSCEKIFRKTMIFNQMQNRHIRNVYFQLQRRGKVTFAVGSGTSVSQCAHLSMQLQRGQCSMLSSFHTNQKSLKCITKCLIICRAALATNFHCFSMMILFALIQFTTVVNLYFRYQNLSDQQYLYQDLFVTFPIFVTINMTSPVSKLSKQLPPKSFFSGRALASMIGQFLLQLVTQTVFINYMYSLQVFHPEMEAAHAEYVQNKQFSQTSLTLATFILTNYLYLGIVLCTSVSGPFRKPFYTNPYYTCTLIALWFYNTAIVLLPEIVPDIIREEELSQQIQEILVMAMLLGNLMMIVMYLYENLLVWIISVINRVKAKLPASDIQLIRM